MDLNSHVFVASVASDLAGVTPPQMATMAKHGLIEQARGRGARTLYSLNDLYRMALYRRLATLLSLKTARSLVKPIRDLCWEDLGAKVEFRLADETGADLALLFDAAQTKAAVDLALSQTATPAPELAL